MKVKITDTSTVEGKIEVMRAHANGAKIVNRAKGGNDWCNCEPGWNWALCDYAVIVEPREVWVEFDSEGELVGAYPVKRQRPTEGYTCVRFVETEQ